MIQGVCCADRVNGPTSACRKPPTSARWRRPMEALSNGACPISFCGLCEVSDLVAIFGM